MLQRQYSIYDCCRAYKLFGSAASIVFLTLNAYKMPQSRGVASVSGALLAALARLLSSAQQLCMLGKACLYPSRTSNEQHQATTRTQRISAQRDAQLCVKRERTATANTPVKRYIGDLLCNNFPLLRSSRPRLQLTHSKETKFTTPLLCFPTLMTYHSLATLHIQISPGHLLNYCMPHY
jgi:hypothetical protein